MKRWLKYIIFYIDSMLKWCSGYIDLKKIIKTSIIVLKIKFKMWLLENLKLYMHHMQKLYIYLKLYLPYLKCGY